VSGEAHLTGKLVLRQDLSTCREVFGLGSLTGKLYLDIDTVRGKLVTGQVGFTHKQPTADRTHSHVDSGQGEYLDRHVLTSRLVP
jgi:hypothetical protein